MKNKREFLSGSDVVVRAVRDAGAVSMYGYPITPGTEILSKWIREAARDKRMKYLQTEDEIAAGFAVAGAVLAGEKSFTATAGPGTILMQDALSMAEGMRLPFVAIIVQRGGPSSGTVIYSQQEVVLATHGGNGEGMRIVYSPSSLTELYDMTRRAFNDAARYRFPALVLTDGYLVKTKQVISNFKKIKNIPAPKIVSRTGHVNLRNIFTVEEELNEEILRAQKDYVKMSKTIAKSESYLVADADTIIIAHGIVGRVARDAVDKLRARGLRVGLWRPLTLAPLDVRGFAKTRRAKNFVVAESSAGQLADLLKNRISNCPNFSTYFRPALGIETDEIVKFVMKKYAKK
ncbi:MAG TPA: thiamine pyrophosphate-binding protein [Candidatus Magasanikbacteria bacterium]|nr:thiamine pyrophosphate-binding protein [Candidatus Magasanikbacteria bacterium]